MQPTMSDAVMQVLSESQRLGFLGDRPIDEVVDHARAFVDALEGVTGSVIDLGAGGGLPGFVIATIARISRSRWSIGAPNAPTSSSGWCVDCGGRTACRW